MWWYLKLGHLGGDEVLRVELPWVALVPLSERPLESSLPAMSHEDTGNHKVGPHQSLDLLRPWFWISQLPELWKIMLFKPPKLRQHPWNYYLYPCHKPIHHLKSFHWLSCYYCFVRRVFKSRCWEFIGYIYLLALFKGKVNFVTGDSFETWSRWTLSLGSYPPTETGR